MKIVFVDDHIQAFSAWKKVSFVKEIIFFFIRMVPDLEILEI